jgi:pimeloyl-ACP methyl ester carboxylesterase
MHYILIHGAWQGSWCWELLAKELIQIGHTVSSPDLPGHGASPFPITEVTYDIYYRFLAGEIQKVPEPVVLVAHSMSGILAAPLLDSFPERIAHLFLVGAFVAQNGKSLLDIAIAGGPSEIPKVIINHPETRTQSLDPQKAKNALYHDVPSEIADWAIARLQPQAVAPFATPVHWKDSGKTCNKRTYILCQNDRDVHISTQLGIVNNYPCRTVSLPSGHFPFLSQPKQLADILVTL